MSIGATRCSPITCRLTYLRPTCSPIYPASSQRRVTSEPSPSLGIRASPSTSGVTTVHFSNSAWVRRDRCKRALHAWRSEAGDSDLTATAYERFRRAASVRWPTRNTVAHTFGSWRAALEACGLPTDAARSAECITRAVRTGAARRSARRLAQRDSIAEAVRRCRADLGGRPAALEFFRWRLQAAPETPSQMSV